MADSPPYAAPQTCPGRPSDLPSVSKIHPDQICVYKYGSENSNRWIIAYVIERKALVGRINAHKA